MSKHKPAYTEEQTKELHRLYLEEKKSVEEIAAILQRRPKSVRSKLVRDKVYVAPQKTNSKTNPGKKQLVLELEDITGLSFDSLIGANKSDLQKLKEWALGVLDDG